VTSSLDDTLYSIGATKMTGERIAGAIMGAWAFGWTGAVGGLPGVAVGVVLGAVTGALIGVENMTKVVDDTFDSSTDCHKPF